MQATLLAVLAGACSALVVAPLKPVQALQRVPVTESPVMLADGTQSRRAMLASLGAVAIAPAANAMTVPGLNSKGLVPQTKTKTGPAEFTSVRDSSSFWSAKGIMDSVPKVKGIITPKTPVK
uniref:Uncharacterized protein n=1 Tax=Calcidiscus leptoporus TaxID=127549 RepID=A0A7S0JHI6_9EUKA|mmetsp:Transcript_59028/g.135366  ORF Transcript_59028/g.135366 Transcript_59028/m.135366 type:complete len:122 (+) Transcript_59028:18-383(+)